MFNELATTLRQHIQRDAMAEANPHFPALWSDPMAVAKTSRRKQIPSSQAAKVKVRGAEECVVWLHPVEVGEQHVLRILRAAS
jgi:hypothetical protein